MVEGDTPCHTEMTFNKSGGGQSGNLKRHLRRFHPHEFELVQSKDDVWKQSPQVIREGGADEALNDEEIMASLAHREDEPWLHNGVPLETGGIEELTDT